LVLAHREELIQQASRKLHDVGIDHGIIKAGYTTRFGERVQVASVQTLYARAVRGCAIDLPTADLVVVDECHHIRARTYQQILDGYPEAVVLGVTATPCRGDGKGLGNVFDVLIESATVAELIAGGYLVKARVYAPSRPDLTGVQIRAGDYVESQLAQRVDKPELVGDIVTHWLKLAAARTTIVFATSVAHSVHIRDEFRRSGILAEHIDGTTPAEERKEILARLEAGKVEVVSNCAVLTEGFDCPVVSCIVLARPTKSIGLFHQMAGRGLRPAPGKADCIILDHAGAVFQHGLINEAMNWTLREDKRAENPAQSNRSRGHKPGLTNCPECSAVRTEGKPCPACGWRPRPKPLAVDVADGELAEVGPDGSVHAAGASMAEKQLFYRELIHIAVNSGSKPGVAFYKFQERYKGEKPPFHWQSLSPLPPRPETAAWYRSRQIAYAKARQKAGSERGPE
jgi:superfamily II DNA or RNA helicase